MKKLLMSVAFIALAGSIVPADAASTIAIGGGLNLGHVQATTGAASIGTAAAGSLANGTTTNIGAGFAAASPAGGISRIGAVSMSASTAAVAQATLAGILVRAAL